MPRRDPSIEELSRRLDAVEQENRRLRQVLEGRSGSGRSNVAPGVDGAPGALTEPRGAAEAPGRKLSRRRLLQAGAVAAGAAGFLGAEKNVAQPPFLAAGWVTSADCVAATRQLARQVPGTCYGRIPAAYSPYTPVGGTAPRAAVKTATSVTD